MHRFRFSTIAIPFVISSAILAWGGNDPPLIQAAKRGDLPIVRQLLVEQHANPNDASADGSTALLWAVDRDHVEVAGALIKAGANVRTAILQWSRSC